jgi:hypothetical protein
MSNCRAPVEYVTRSYPACAGCAARGAATEAQMAASWEWRERFRPARVRLLLIAESPPRTVGEAPLRHFYHPAGPPPDTLFRAVAPTLLGTDAIADRRPERKEAALCRLAAGGFFLLDSAQCPVNHLSTPASRRDVVCRCAAVVLRQQLTALSLEPEARIGLVVRGTVPAAVLPVLQELGLAERVVHPDGLPFPGRWPGRREAFQHGVRLAAMAAAWEFSDQEPGV